MKETQTTLLEKRVSKRWPKHHRMRKTKNSGTDDYYPEEKTFESIIKKAKELGIDTFVVGFSGGKDSGKVLDKTQKIGICHAVLHLDTKIGVKPTRLFVEDECTKRNLKLFVRPPTPLAFAYVAFCLEFGFPGPKLHAAIMKILKYNSMKKFIQEPQFRNKKVAIVGGIRKFESKERMANYDAPITREGDLWFVNPIFYEKDNEVYRYFIENNLKRSPSYEVLGFSGECMCGSYAGHDEAKRLERIDPDLLDMFSWIEEGIRRWGTPEAKKYGKWGKGGYGAADAKMQNILGLFFDPEEIKDSKRIENITCGSECGPGTMRGQLDY